MVSYPQIFASSPALNLRAPTRILICGKRAKALAIQAGVAIGMTTIAAMQLPEYGSEIRAVILCATLIYELLGPVLTKIVLTKAGEIKPDGKQKPAAAK